MTLKTIKVLYFSGTGNSHQLAKMIQDHSHIPTIINSIENCNQDNDLPQNSSEMLITIAPTHGFTIVWSLFKFLLTLPKNKGTPAVVITTRAAWKIGPLFLPGMSGSSNFIAGLLLLLKGYKIKGMLAIDMPSNWLVMHWGLHPKNVEISSQNAKRKLTLFMNNIFQGNKVFFNWNNLYEFIAGVLLLRISFIYFCFARFIFAKILFAGKDCTSCNLCAKNCPVKAIKMHKARPFWRYNCESCMRCVANCPTKTINASHPWMILIFISASIPVATYLGITHTSMSFIASLCFTFICAWVLYFWLYFLSRIPILDKIFTYTSLSHYFRRYKARN